MFEATALAWYNGHVVARETAAPSIASHSLHLGIGVFDGAMAYWNDDHHHIYRLAGHLRRFGAGTSRMGLTLRWPEEELAAGIDGLLRNYPGQTLYIRPIAYRSAPQINITGSAAMPVDVAIFGVSAPRDTARPLRVMVSSYERISARSIPVHWKICGTYVNSYLARREAETAGFDDAIMLDRHGLITEASAANVFFIHGNRLHTPALTDDVFPGITRQAILEWAQCAGVEVSELPIHPRDIAAYDAAFLCATLMEIVPLICMGTTSFRTTESALFRDILAWFRRQTRA